LSKVAVNVLLEVGSLVNVGEVVAVDVGTSVAEASINGVNVGVTVTISLGNNDGMLVIVEAMVGFRFVGVLKGAGVGTQPISARSKVHAVKRFIVN
jgi:hypothetical protein